MVVVLIHAVNVPGPVQRCMIPDQAIAIEPFEVEGTNTGDGSRPDTLLTLSMLIALSSQTMLSRSARNI